MTWTYNDDGSVESSGATLAETLRELSARLRRFEKVMRAGEVSPSGAYSCPIVNGGISGAAILWQHVTLLATAANACLFPPLTPSESGTLRTVGAVVPECKPFRGNVAALAALLHRTSLLILYGSDGSWPREIPGEKLDRIAKLAEAFANEAAELESQSAPLVPQENDAAELEPQSAGSVPKPREHDCQAWKLRESGLASTQREIAEALNREHRTKYSQGQVSKMLARYEEWLTAHAPKAAESAPVAVPTRTVDPSKLELGPDRTGLTRRQRRRS
jgi:hypothetical protein